MHKRIHHIGIAVKDLDESLRKYRDQLGFDFEGRETVESENVEVAIFNVGESKVELVRPLDASGPVGKFLEKRGEGFHHIALEVEDVQRELNELRSKGAPVLDEEPRIGAGGHKVAFIHPKGASGVLLELIEVSD